MPEPEKSAARDEPPSTMDEELIALFVGAFIRSRPTKKEARAFLAEADALAKQIEVSTRFMHPASAAVRAAAVRRRAVEWYWRARPDLEALI